ncbi:hypothetical protein P4S70_01750 [Enterovibrio sp. Hal110]
MKNSFKPSIKKLRPLHASLLPFHYDARFPHLAFDRFSTSLPAALTTQEGKSQWLAYVHGLGEKQLHTALAWQNGLTPQRRESLQQCQEQLAQSSIESELFWAQVDETPVVIPSAYQPWEARIRPLPHCESGRERPNRRRAGTYPT